VLNDFFLAIGTLSRIRVPTIKKVNYQRSTIYFPVVGFVAAGILFCVTYLCGFLFSQSISRILGLIVYYMLFGYFHFDGLLDCIDGFFPSHKSKEDRLRIMKDSNTGAFALLFGVLFLMLEIFCALNAVEYWFFFPVFGRFTPLFLMTFSKAATDTGLGKVYFPYKKKYLLFSIIFLLPFFFISLHLLYGIIAVALIAFVVAQYAKSKIGGTTGDVIGLSIMISELAFLLYLNSIPF